MQLLQSTTVSDSTRRRAADSLEKIAPGNEIAIADPDLVNYYISAGLQRGRLVVDALDRQVGAVAARRLP